MGQKEKGKSVLMERLEVKLEREDTTVQCHVQYVCGVH